MSIKVITAVLDLAPAVVTPAERLVLLALGWHSDEHGRNAWPAVSTLARKTSLTRRSVQRTLHTLKRKGLVYVDSKGTRRSVLYGIDMAALDCDRYSQSKPCDCDTVSQSTPDDRDAESPPCDTVSPPLRHTVAPPATQCRPIRPLTVREPSEKKNAAARRLSAPEEHPEDQNDEDRADDDAAALTRIAHETFDALGDDAPFPALADAFIGRLNGRRPDHILDHLGSFLFNVRKERHKAGGRL